MYTKIFRTNNLILSLLLITDLATTTPTPEPDGELKTNSTVPTSLSSEKHAGTKTEKLDGNLEFTLKKEKEDKPKDSPDPNALAKLGTLLEKEGIDLPTETESLRFMEQIDALKQKNEEGKLLGLIDQIICMTKDCKILDHDLNHTIPDSIVVMNREGNNLYEYIVSQVTKKWIEFKFQISPGGQFLVQLKTPHLVQVTDMANNTCDILGLLIMHNSAMRRNRIIPEYLVKNEPLNPPGPTAVADYSTFKGHYAPKKRSAGAAPPAKVSN